MSPLSWMIVMILNLIFFLSFMMKFSFSFMKKNNSMKKSIK